VYRLCRI